jgi:hypothetical protein
MKRKLELESLEDRCLQAVVLSPAAQYVVSKPVDAASPKIMNAQMEVVGNAGPQYHALTALPGIRSNHNETLIRDVRRKCKRRV